MYYAIKELEMSAKAVKDATRVDRRVVRTRRAIMEAFERLLEKKDLGDITISSIAREADIDRKTFYLHFGSIDGLLDAIAEDAVSYISSTVEEALGHEATSSEDVELAANTFFAVVNRAVKENIVLNKRLFEVLPAEELISRIRKPLEKRLLMGHLVPTDLSSEMFEYYLSFLLSGIVGIYRAWVLGGGKVPIEDVSAVANELMLKGLSSVEARL